MAGHLVNTFLLLAFLTLSAWWARPDARGVSLRGRGTLASLLGLAMLGTLVVGMTGAVTALGDTLFPAESLAHGLAQDLSPTAHFLIRLRVWHPVTAVAVGLFIVGVSTWTGAKRPVARRLALWMVALFFAQIAGGLLNLALLAPSWMQLVHLLMADTVWMSLVVLSATALRGDAADRGTATEASKAARLSPAASGT